MFARPHIEQTDPPLSPKETLPTMYDLKSEDPEEPGLPDEYHIWQSQLLSFGCQPSTYPLDQVFVASDLNLYYDVNHPLWYKRPDWFVVVGVPRLYEQREMRLSYVIWQEGVRPLLMVELLSPSTRDEDLGNTIAQAGKPPTKWEVYERILGVPYYIVFDRYTDQLQVFQLQGSRYKELALSETEPRIWIPELELGLGLWSGEYQEVSRLWLRWYDAQGNCVLTEAEAERSRAIEAESRAAKLEARLRAAGLDPDI
jgi:Uma2 family endonuclease